ncbi:MAG TPA: transposase [Gaiellaceae bacterium]|jgi:REP element-mobilizing transposase RayT|nr:transposase [Gaiellaceae bacterium]
MARLPRDQSPGYYHVVTRGNNKRSIFLDEDDRWFFCITVDRIALRYGWTVIAYCLMGNHYHLILSIGDKGLSDGMRDLNTAVACRFNVKHGRINHLFGKRFWSRRIKTHASILSAIRYVVQNPRRAGGSKPLEAYVWSSYAASIGLAFARIRLARDELLAFFGSNPEHAAEEFRVFCSARGFT